MAYDAQEANKQSPIGKGIDPDEVLKEFGECQAAAVPPVD